MKDILGDMLVMDDQDHGNMVVLCVFFNLLI